MNELLKKLCQFVGYGSPNAKVIFMGIEEKTHDNDEISYARRLEIQGELEPYTDLAELCGRLTVARLYNPQRSNPQPQPTWAPLCSVMLGLVGKRDQMDKDWAVIEYQRGKLGRMRSNSLLTELLPVPKYSVNTFEDHVHGRLLGIRAESGTTPLDAYHETVLRLRQNLLAEMLKERFTNGSQPRLIVAYGRPWPRFEPIFQQIGPMQYNHDPKGRFKWAKFRECIFALTWHPAAREKWEPMKFGMPVAREIVDIYHEHFGKLDEPEH